LLEIQANISDPFDWQGCGGGKVLWHNPGQLFESGSMASKKLFFVFAYLRLLGLKLKQ
jgi:hypothetical protein